MIRPFCYRIAMTSERVRIGFITAGDVRDRRSQSGVPYRLSTLLQSHVGDVRVIDKLRPDHVTVGHILRNLGSTFTLLYLYGRLTQCFWRLLGRKHHWERTPRMAQFYARIIEERLRNEGLDVLFADKASVQIACLKTSLPIV